MTHDLEVRGHSAGQMSYPVAYDYAAPSAAESNAFHVAHRLLRGRYLLAIILASIGAAGGGAIGYLSQTPKYRSEGQIHIRPVSLTFDGRESIMPMFTSFVATQRTYLRSDRVIFRAMDSEAWRAMGRPRDPENDQKFRRSLRADSPPDAQEIIFVAFTDLEPRASKIAVEEVIKAYDELHGNGEFKEKEVLFAERVKKLFEIRSSIDLEQKAIEREAVEFGDTLQLEAFVASETSTCARLSEEITEIEMQLAGLPEAPAAADPGVPPPPAAPPTPQEIARVDLTMRSHLANREAVQRLLDSRINNGYGERHPDVIRLKSDLESWQVVIENNAREWVPAADAPILGNGTLAVEYLRRKHGQLEKQYERHRVKLMDVQSKRSAIRKSQREIDRLTDEATEVKSMIEKWTLEKMTQQAVGQITAIPPLSIPSHPNVDSRKKFAAAGFVLGGGFPIAVIALIGLLDRRFRYSDDARTTGPSVALLGMLPMLPRSGAPAEQAAAAAHSVHQIRSLIQLSAPDRRVIAVTSATAGDGKTSLTLSLGMSFAASGARTLLVDFDMIGRGLSRQLKLNSTHGLTEALQAGELNGCIAPTTVPGLSVISLHEGGERFVNRLSEAMVQRFVESLRPGFDVVLIDTGPILGSLEANFVTAASDGVLMIVGRGQQRPLVQRALAHLDAVGSHVLGLIFNRASLVDFNRSSSSASFRTVSTVPADALAVVPLPPEVADMDPISRTLAVDIRG